MDYAEVLRSLSSRGARFAVAGGFACLVHGVVRVTLDLDLLVEVSDDNLACLWETLSDLGFVTQHPVSRADVVSAERVARLAREKHMQAFSWVHGTHPFVIVDLLFGEGFQWSTAHRGDSPLRNAGARPPVGRADSPQAGRWQGEGSVDVRELQRLC